MAYSAEITAKLGLDSAGFSAGLQSARTGIERFGGDATRTLSRAFNVGSIVKGFLGGLGIGSALAVFNGVKSAIMDAAGHADKLTEKFSAAASAAREISTALEKVGKSDADVASLMEGQIQKLKDARTALLDAPLPKSYAAGLVERGSAADKLMGFTRDEELARAEKLKQINEAIGQLVLGVANKKQQITQQTDSEAIKAQQALYRGDEARADAAKDLADFERAQRREKMTTEELLVDLEKERREVTKSIAAYEQEVRQGMVLTADGNKELLDLKKQQKTLEQQIAEATAAKARGEKAIGAQVASNIAAWKDFKVLIETTGRGDRELSDRELARKAAELRGDISLREAALLTSGGVFTGAQNQDPFLQAQRSNLSQLLAEQDLRERTRRRVARRGEDRAFAESGLSEQRFADILRNGLPENPDQRRTADSIQRIERMFERGITIVPSAT